jgi:hypothetical protein
VAFGPYLVFEELGVGGMAQVHRAETRGIEGFSRSVALKRMLPHLAGNDEFIRAFVREARLASHLRHTNVAQTYDLGMIDGIYYIAMELIEGRDLRNALRQSALATGPMPVPIALNILGQICDALDYAHNLRDETGQPLGIIHRDVSPSNIIISRDGVLKLIDFGIAKASAAGMQTMSGTVKGKFAYMAPEYIAGSIDSRADLFAVGVIAHELLTASPLFAGADDGETVFRLRNLEIPRPSAKNPRVPPEIDDLVMTALARDPERRWQVASAMRAVIGTVSQRMGLVAHNHEVTQWLEWAFAQPLRPEPYGEEHEPEIAVEVRRPTVEVGPDMIAATIAAAAPRGTLPGAPPPGGPRGTPSAAGQPGAAAPLATMIGVAMPPGYRSGTPTPAVAMTGPASGRLAAASTPPSGAIAAQGGPTSGPQHVQHGPPSGARAAAAPGPQQLQGPAWAAGPMSGAAPVAPPPSNAQPVASAPPAKAGAGRKLGFGLLILLAAGGAAAAVYFALIALS